MIHRIGYKVKHIVYSMTPRWVADYSDDDDGDAYGCSGDGGEGGSELEKLPLLRSLLIRDLPLSASS